MEMQAAVPMAMTPAAPADVCGAPYDTPGSDT